MRFSWKVFSNTDGVIVTEQQQAAVQSHAQSIMDACKRHDLEALVPYMGEMAVVRAVVRCAGSVVGDQVPEKKGFGDTLMGCCPNGLNLYGRGTGP